MQNLRNVTLNGRPVQEFINAELAKEIHVVKVELVAEKRWHRPACGSKFRNVSGSRSGRGRVIFSAVGQS